MPKPVATPAARIADIERTLGRNRSHHLLTPWEKNFLASLGRREGDLSEEQERALKRIEQKVYDERDEEEDDEDTLGSVDRRWDRHHTRRD